MNYRLREPIIYFFAKSNNIYFQKLNYVKEFLERNNILLGSIFYDIYERNKLKFKNKFNKILLTYKDTDICVLSVSDIGESSTDYLNVLKICAERNNRIFVIELNDFIEINKEKILNAENF